MSEKMILNIEETAKYVDLGVLCYNENGKKVYYKLVPLTIEESQISTPDGIPLQNKLVPLTTNQLKEIGIEETVAQEGEYVDIEESQPQAEEAKSKMTITGTPEAIQTAKKILESAQQKQTIDPEKEQLKDENDDLKNKLSIIAEKKLDEKRKEVSGKINNLIRDPTRKNEMITKLATSTPDEISATSNMMQILEEQLGKNQNQRHETPAGSAPMNPDYNPNGANDDIYKKRFGSYTDMITALRTESKSEDKQKAQHANLVLNQLLNKYAVAQRDVRTEQRFCEDDSIVKSDKVPTVDFSQANESFSELERFGIRKSPLNYCKQRRIIAQKGDN